MRALAHPLRIDILQFLAEAGNATATECAREVGESPQSCSYHLRALARYGFVERVASDDGRETRWTLVHRALTFASTGADTPAGRTATQLLQRQVLERDDRIVREYLHDEERFERAWRDAAAFTSGSILVTPKELERLSKRIGELLRSYQRLGEPGPKGARRVHVTLRAVPRVTERKKP